jgi:NAD+ diphosphatase
MSATIPFCGGTLDRADFRRRDEAWLREQLADDTTRLLPVWKLAVLVREDDPRLAWATPALLDGRDDPEPVFLGVDGDVAHFAVDVSASSEPVAEFGLEGVAHFPDLRAAAAQLPGGEAGIAAQARHLVDWHSRHGFCPGCGEPTRHSSGGWSRVCPSCSAEHFPRTDPVVIMLVTDGERCLLGRQKGWPGVMFSALAGFVEPGETLEEAVVREIHEEAGLRAGNVHYRFSQPWPFPASLMMGCFAEAFSTEITVDTVELEEARWFSRDEIRAAMAAPTATLMVPPPIAIAHHLLAAWLA